MSIKRYYFKDFFKFCIIEIYDRLLKPKSDSYFWTFLDAINIKNKSHRMHGTIYVYICSPIIQAWFNFVNSCREFRDNLKYSPIGFLFFLDFHKPGKYEQNPEYTHPLRNRYPIDSVYIPGNSSLFNTLKYKLVFQHGWWDFQRGYINIQSGHNVRDNLFLKQQAFPTSMGTNNYKMQWSLNRPGNNFYTSIPFSIDHYSKYRPWCFILLSWNVAPLFCAAPIVDYIHDYNNPLPGIIDTSKNLGFEEMFPTDAKFLFHNRMLLRSDQFYDPQWGGHDNKSTLDIFWVNYDLSLNIFANLIFLNLIFNFLSIIFLFKIFLYSVKPLKIFNDFIIRNIYLFFWDLFKNLVLNIRLERFFFIIISYFFCIVFFNLGGFSFYELSFMSHVSVTFFFSFSIFINYIINIFINFNELIYLKFVQKANIFLVPFLFIIEIISFLVRPFSLGIRLFANVMSGHILMHMFFSTFVFCYKISFWVSLIIFSFCMFIFFMELFVSFIQAYIFMILLLVYSADLVNIH